MKKLSFIFIAMLVTGYSHAVGSDKIYFGGGLVFNSLSGIDLSDGMGFQFFGGYDLPVKMGKGKLSLVVCYMDSCYMEFGSIFGILVAVKATGLWGSSLFGLSSTG